MLNNCFIYRIALQDVPSINENKYKVKETQEHTMTISTNKDSEIDMIDCLAYGTVTNPRQAGGPCVDHIGGVIYESVS